ncbi:nucleotide disphospho-sugar-binding domain-containing protein, partial [Nocardiopsis sp. MG754419]|uniref:nucleotide disphospho-sugar-binding domain-containing protein n=1 Tax=Nocardiopsis sp. MG754419 TaxID=2259865 RepID=UPI0035B141EE|nr:glycosyl transferase [Nocardiopsis sp. MG754419]
FAPLHALLPTCSAVVHHGGFGTTATATAAGVPQLVLPQQFDTALTCARLAEQGAAVLLDTASTDGARVRDTVERMLSEEGFSGRAARLRDEVRSMPSPNEVVPEIEERVARLRG